MYVLVEFGLLVCFLAILLFLWCFVVGLVSVVPVAFDCLCLGGWVGTALAGLLCGCSGGWV